MQKGLDQILLTTRENLAGIRVIRAFQTQKEEQKAFEKESHTLMQDQLRVGWISALMNPLTYLIVNGAIIVLVWAGAFEVNTGRCHMGGDDRTCQLYDTDSDRTCGTCESDRIFHKGRLHLREESTRCLLFVQRWNLRKSRIGKKYLMKKCEAVLFDHVQFRYHGSKQPALSDVTFSVSKGETVGIIGGTGSGKSTLVNLIPRFYDASEGRVPF